MRVLVHIPDRVHVTTRILAFSTQAAVTDQLLTHLRTRAATGPPQAGPGASRPPSRSMIGAARRARSFGIEPPPSDDDPSQGLPDDPRRR